MRYLSSIIILIALLSSRAYGQADSAVIFGNIDFARTGDTVMVRCSPYGTLDKFFPPDTTMGTITGHRFRLTIHVAPHPQFINMILMYQGKPIRLLSAYLIEAGDSVVMGANGALLEFHGRGAAKYRLADALDSIARSYLARLVLNSPETVKGNFDLQDSMARTQLRYLDSHSRMINPEALLLIRSQIVADNISKGIWLRAFAADKALLGAYVEALRGYRPDPEISMRTPAENDGMLAYAYRYPQAVIDRYRIEKCILKNHPFVLKECIAYLATTYSGILRERLILELLVNNSKWSDRVTSLVTPDIVSSFGNDALKKKLLELRSHTPMATKIYDFELIDISGKRVGLSAFKGKVLVIDFWFTGCLACMEMNKVLKTMDTYFAGKPIAFININVDGDIQQWKKSVLSGNYTAAGSINLWTRGEKKKHPLVNYLNIRGFPTLVFVDENGELMDPPADPRMDGGRSMKSLLQNYAGSD